MRAVAWGRDRKNFFGQHNGPAAVLRLAGHLKVAFELEHFAKAFAHDHVILSEQNGDFFHKMSGLVLASLVSDYSPPFWRTECGP